MASNFEMQDKSPPSIKKFDKIFREGENRGPGHQYNRKHKEKGAKRETLGGHIGEDPYELENG